MDVSDPRTASIHAMFDTSGRGLEIGPSYNPIVPKRLGFQVDIVDHLSTGDLKAKYADENSVDVSRIEEVDYVWDGRPLSEIIGEPGRYDYIVASHVIEHMPDFLGFLEECDFLLKPTGTLFLAVPDKRRCFDIFRPLTSTGDILQAHLERRRVHSAGIAFDHVAYFATLAGAGGWAEGTKGELKLEHALSFAKSIFDRSIRSEEYYDFHAWIFTPSSFRLVLHDLNEVGVLDLRETAFQNTSGIEFFITLSQSGRREPLERIALAHKIHEELREFPN